MTETDEKVLCVGRNWITFVSDGLSHDDLLAALLAQATYRNRHTPNDDGPPVEEDSRWKQLIPYIVCVNSKGQILAYNRGWKGGEGRLKGRWAIGFGGHVNDQDHDWNDGVWREIEEELSFAEDELPPELLHGPIGFIDDDSDDVGRHHLGVVYILRADEVTPRENPEFAWTDRPDLTVSGTLESWARLALPMVRKWMEAN